MYVIINTTSIDPIIASSVQAVALYTGIPTDTLYGYFSRKKVREFSNERYHIYKRIVLTAGDMKPDQVVVATARVRELLAMKVDTSDITGDDIIDYLIDQDADGECHGINVEPILRCEEELGGPEELAKLLQYANQSYRIWYDNAELML